MTASARAERAARLTAVFATIAAALVFVVIASSAWLRLAQSGLGCDGWPQCYGAFRGAAEASPSAAPSAELRVGEVRAVHRVTASAAGLAIALGAVIWLSSGRRRRGVTAIVVALLALTAFLALLGRYTPGAQAPAVMLGNMLGGMVLLTLAWILRVLLVATPWPPVPRALHRMVRVALVVTAVQIVLGGLVSAQYAALACTTFPDCNGLWWPSTWQWSAFDPAHATAAADGNVAHAARQTLHIAHRYGAVLMVLGVGVLAAALWRHGASQRTHAAALAALLVIQIAIGTALIVTPPLLALTVLHDVAAALLLAAVAGVACRARAA